MWYSRPRIGVILSLAILCVAGCQHARHDLKKNDMVEISGRICFEAEERIPLVSRTTGEKQVFTVKINVIYDDNDAWRRGILDEAGDPRTRGHRLLLMYLTNAVLAYVSTGEAPENIVISSDTTVPVQRPRPKDLFIEGPVFFNREHLLLSWDEGRNVAEFGKPVPQAAQLQWRELTPVTWSDWWGALDAQWRLRHVFEEPKRECK